MNSGAEIAKDEEIREAVSLKYRFDRLEFAGSLGDLGVLLPLGIGMILINGLSAMGLCLSVGLFYIFSGLYYGVTVPVQPMKVIGAYAVATAMSPAQISASAAWIGLIMLIIGGSGAITLIGRYTPKSVINGVQLSTGVLLMAEGVRFMMGTSRLQQLQNASEPYLAVQNLGPVPLGILLGVAGAVLTFFLIDNKKLPAGLIVVLTGLFVGLTLGTHQGFDRLEVGLSLPDILPFGFPTRADFTLALLLLVIPQVPMTLGNAVIANADLSKQYFGEASRKVTYKGLCISMGLANFLAFFLGGMPLCHGAGGLAAHYRFGARTAGSNLMIGAIFVALAVFLGSHALSVLYLLPMSILGILLLFAGNQLAMTVIDVKERKDMFVVLVILGITVASNLAVGFIVGIVLAYALCWDKLNL
ncbi:MAG: sulfate permease [Syntrophobacteraceae bacterium]|nr:sulfate permease [Syntrophobacteraceae bacterium]